MAVRIRLTRMGAKKRPFYRIVVIDGRKARDAKVLDTLGFYDPIAEKTPQLQLDGEKAQAWIAKGAQPSETVASLLKRSAAPAEKATA